MGEALLEIKNLDVAFETNRGDVRPVRDVSLTIYPGQTVALVGESGCGKSVTAMSILRLIPSPPGKVLGGEIRFSGRDLLTLSEREMRAVRGKDIAMIFQEPMTSLNPVYTIGDQIGMAIMLITHDLGVVAENADVVAVMYASRIVEVATVENLFDKPLHPYTEGLFHSVPKLGADVQRLDTIPGTVPNPARFPTGCKF